MKRALDEFYISPIKTTIGIQQKIMSHPKFISGDVTTHFLEEMGRIEDKESPGGRK
jgi:acetyl-CoA carboxylase biotin carboxylase subunit